MKNVAVVILNWNGRFFLEKFLPYVIEYSSDVADIIVADNASSDDSVEFLKQNFKEIKIILNETNGGFSKGYNDALEKLNYKYYILLNSDIEVTKNWIKPIIDLMESDDNIAVCQPKLLSYKDKKVFEYAGAAGGFIDSFGYPFCRGRIFNTLENDNEQYNDTYEIFWATGAAMFVRADVYHKVGGLDNDFFAHMEEIDFCWRVKNLGYKVMYCHKATVFHVGGGTLPKNNSRKTYLNFRNNFYLLLKNLPTKRLFIVFPVRIILDYIAAIKFLTEGGFKDFFAVTKAHFSFYFSICKTLKKRQKNPHLKVKGVYKRSIVWDYYVLRKSKFNQLSKKDFTN
jgi:hypothetical protein